MHNQKTPVLVAKQVRRSFDKEEVLKGVDIVVHAGEIKALLGPNGAGKTTLSKICSGVLLQTSGEVTVNGIDVAKKPRQARGYLSLVMGGDYGFYNRATARDNLLFFADLQGVANNKRAHKVAQVLELVKLTDTAHKKVGEFSRGMKQRLHLARGLLTDPQLLILDEITSGLDPDIARDVRALIREIANNGTAILLTTHLLTEVQELADSVDLLFDGQVCFTGKVPELIAETSITAVSEFEIGEFTAELQAKAESLGLAEIDCAPNASGYKVTGYWYSEPAQELQQLLAAAHYVVTRPPTVEEAYLALIAKLGAAQDIDDASSNSPSPAAAQGDSDA